MVPALNEGAYLRSTVAGLIRTVPPSSEIIVVDDGSTDGSSDGLETEALDGGPRLRILRGPRQGAAGARNHGASAARGDILVFADAHLDLPGGWYEPLAAEFDDPEVGAVGPVIEVMGRPDCRGYGMYWANAGFDIQWFGASDPSPHEAPLLCGCCVAVRRDDFMRSGGFDAGLIRWGMEDAELSLRLWLLGRRLVVHPSVVVGHLFRTKHPYEIDYVDVVHNMLRTALIHFSGERLTRVIETLKRYGAFSAALSRAADSDVMERRAALAAQRVRSDDWFFERFDEIL